MDEEDIAGLAAEIGAFSLRSALSALNPFGGRRGGAPRPKLPARGGYSNLPRTPYQPPPQYNPYNAGWQYAPQQPLYPPQFPGTPQGVAGLLGASWPLFQFVAATGTNAVTQQMNPQGILRGQRLVCTILRVGTSAGATAPLITGLQVGMVPFLMTPDGVAADQYAPNAVDTNILLPKTQPGVLYVMSMRLPVALAGTDTITVIASIQGTSNV